jgi:hypothetical protein
MLRAATCYLLEREALQSLVGMKLCLGQIVENALHLAVLADHAVRVKRRRDGDEMRWDEMKCEVRGERGDGWRGKRRGERVRGGIGWKERMGKEGGQVEGEKREEREGREKRDERGDERREARVERRDEIRWKEKRDERGDENEEERGEVVMEAIASITATIALHCTILTMWRGRGRRQREPWALPKRREGRPLRRSAAP